MGTMRTHRGQELKKKAELMSGARSTSGRKKANAEIKNLHRDRSVALLHSIKEQSGISWENLEKLCGLSRGTLSRYSRGKRILGDVLYKLIVMTYLTKVAVPRTLKEHTLSVVHMPGLHSIAEDFARAVESEREAMMLQQAVDRLKFENKVRDDLARLQKLTEEFRQRLIFEK